MKVRGRIVSCVTTLVLLVIVSLCWTSLRIRYKKAIGLLPDHVVIFGNDYSGIPPAGDGVHKRSVASRTWTQSLCESIHASCDSFAPADLLAADEGAAVDNVMFNSSAPDLREQVDAWMTRERMARKAGNVAERSSMFVVFFGINDVWKYSSYAEKDGLSAVEASLDSMFDSLRRVAANWVDPIQVLIPNLMDITMLPAWNKHRLATDAHGVELRNAIHLVKKWNEGLELRAKKHSAMFGSVMLWDCNQWFMNTIRRGGWKDVKEGCVKGDRSCDHPDAHLMWDELHLSPKAHEKMAREVLEYLI